MSILGSFSDIIKQATVHTRGLAVHLVKKATGTGALPWLFHTLGDHLPVGRRTPKRQSCVAFSGSAAKPVINLGTDLHKTRS